MISVPSPLYRSGDAWNEVPSTNKPADTGTEQQLPDDNMCTLLPEGTVVMETDVASTGSLVIAD